MENTKKSNVKKVLNIVGTVVLIAFLLLCIFTLVLTVFSEKDIDGTAEIFGYQFRIVTSSSMEKSEFIDVSDYDIKSIPIRSMVFVQTVPEDEKKAAEWYDDIEKGDVLTFRYVYASQVTITHRVDSIIDNGDGGYTITLLGDNRASEYGAIAQVINTSEENTSNYIIGKVTGKSYLLGALLSVLKSKLGVILLIMVPCLLIISFEVSRIIKALTEDKKKKAAEEMARKDEELSELRRQLELLQKQSDKADAADDTGIGRSEDKTL